MTATDVLGVLLAGGQARRMGGGDKALKVLAGRPLIAHVIARAAPQTAGLLINANGDPKRFAAFDLPVVADSVGGFAGPLAGILTALEWTAAHRGDCRWVVSLPTDSPFLPEDLVARLLAERQAQDAELAVAASGGRSHPVVGLWPVDLAPALRHALTEEDIRKIDRWTARFRLAEVTWPTEPIDPFFNANRPDDLAAAEAMLAGAKIDGGPSRRSGEHVE